MVSEKRRALGILEKIQNKTDPMDVTRAVNQKQARDERERYEFSPLLLELTGAHSCIFQNSICDLTATF